MNTRISTILFALFQFYNLSISLSAQPRKTRLADFKIQIDKTNEGDTFFTPGNIYCKFYIINQGPDSVFKGDLLHVEYRFGGYYFNPHFPKCSTPLGKGDTMIYEYSLKSNGTNNVANGTFCCFAKLAQIYNGDSLIYENNNQLTNNWSCMIANHIVLNNNSNRILQESISIYPNPFTNFFFIENNSDQELALYNLNGRKLGNYLLEKTGAYTYKVSFHQQTSPQSIIVKTGNLHRILIKL